MKTKARRRHYLVLPLPHRCYMSDNDDDDIDNDDDEMSEV
jgi:hypothetical protein